MRPVLALDLATRTGWALLQPSGSVLSGAHRFGRAGKGDRERLRAIEVWLPSFLPPIAQGAGDLVYELTGFRFRNSFRVSGHLEAFVLRAADAFQIPEAATFSYLPTQVKKGATGAGTASKAQVVEAMRERWGLPALDDEDEADALALLTHHLAQREA